MSSMAALVLSLAAVGSPPTRPPASTGLTADQAMANYRTMLRGATDPGAPARDCPESGSGAIIVCAHHAGPSPRLPLPDERAEAGEEIRHANEPGGDPGPPTGPPSRQMNTAMKLLGLLKGAVTGEDPN